MTSVITGDIINSKKRAPRGWLSLLKKELGKLGETPKQWELYRGDSFQVEVRKPVDALEVAIRLKAVVKSIKGLDVRMAIGIGDKTYGAKRITESNGSAFVYSGQLMEDLKKLRQSLALRSNNLTFNLEMNLYLKLALKIMDGWTINSAEIIYLALRNPGKSQEAFGKLLGIRQNAVSARLNRAGCYEILELIEMYRRKIDELK